METRVWLAQADACARGGIGAELTGGDFWQGAGTGLAVGLLNHAAHSIDPMKQLERKLRSYYKELKEIGAFPKDFVGGFKDFYDTYMEMREANLIDSDKYFHSKANYKAALRGKGGEYAAEKLSNLREFVDQRWPKFDSRAASLADQRANIYGRAQGVYHRNLGFGFSYKTAIPYYRKSYFGNH